MHACDGLKKTAAATFEQVIYELTEGERQLIDDLSLIKKVISRTSITALCRVSEVNFLLWSFFFFFKSCLNTCSACFYLGYQVYYEPMLKLRIMTESELGQIFGTLDSLIPLHEG